MTGRVRWAVLGLVSQGNTTGSWSGDVRPPDVVVPVSVPNVGVALIAFWFDVEAA